MPVTPRARAPSRAARHADTPAPSARRAAAAKRAPARKPDAAKSASTDAADAPARVLRQFRLVFNTVKTHFQQVEKRAGVGGAQVWALSVVRAQPGIGVTELARRMDIHQTTASNLVRSLADAGLVRTERKGTDRRAVQVYLEPEAVRVLRKAPGPFTGVLPEALAQLDPAVLVRLEADLAALLDLLDADQRSAGIPLAQM